MYFIFIPLYYLGLGPIRNPHYKFPKNNYYINIIN